MSLAEQVVNLNEWVSLWEQLYVQFEGLTPAFLQVSQSPEKAIARRRVPFLEAEGSHVIFSPLFLQILIKLSNLTRDVRSAFSLTSQLRLLSIFKLSKSQCLSTGFL